MRENAGGFDFGWSFGGGTAMMIQVGDRWSHDVDIFLDDGQILGFLDLPKAKLLFQEKPADYGWGWRSLSEVCLNRNRRDRLHCLWPSDIGAFRSLGDRGVRREARNRPEIIAKKIYLRGSEPSRAMFSISPQRPPGRAHRTDVVAALRANPDHVARTIDRLDKLNPDIVGTAIGQLIILPDYLDIAPESLGISCGRVRTGEDSYRLYARLGVSC